MTDSDRDHGPLAVTILAATLAAFIITRCDGCRDGDVRCDGNVAQVCQGVNWKDEHDCSKQGQKCYTNSDCPITSSTRRGAAADGPFRAAVRGTRSRNALPRET
jgi:hypothetical protein